MNQRPWPTATAFTDADLVLADIVALKYPPQVRLSGNGRQYTLADRAYGVVPGRAPLIT